MSHDAEFTAATYEHTGFNGGTLPSINVEQGFNGGSKAADTFEAKKLPVVDGTADALTGASAELEAAPEFTGDKFSASFTGTKVEEMKVTKVEYLKQEIDTKEFTPEAATLGFAGTEVEDMLITKVEYEKVDDEAEITAEATPEVETLTKTAKDIEITVSPDAK